MRSVLWWILCLVTALWLRAGSAEQLAVASTLPNNNFTALLNGFVPPEGSTASASFVSAEQLTSDLQRYLASGNVPDIVIIPTEMLTLANVEYETLPASWAVAGIPHKYRLQGAIEGRWLGAPFIAGNHLMLYYNKALMDRAPATWAEVAATPPTWKQAVIGWPYNNPQWMVPFLGANNALPLHEKGVDRDALAEALTAYGELASIGVIDPSCDQSCSLQYFTEGKLPLLVEGSWSYYSLLQSLGNDLGVALMPAIAGRPTHSYSTNYVVAIPRRAGRTSTEKWELIRQFFNYLRSNEVQAKLWPESQLLPVLTTRQAALATTEQGALKLILEEMARTSPLPNGAQMPAVWAALTEGMRRYSDGELDAKQASRYILQTIQP